MRDVFAEMPFKVSSTFIVVKGLPVTDYTICPEYLIETEVMKNSK